MDAMSEAPKPGRFDAIIAIDPGIEPAVARVRYDGDVPTYTVRDGIDVTTPEGTEEFIAMMVKLLDDTPRSLGVIIERAHATPQMGTVSCFRYGHAFGIAAATVTTLLIAGPWQRTPPSNVVCVYPQRWKRDLGLTSNKSQSLEMARTMYGTDPWLKRQKDHNRAEALLMAHWLRHHEDYV